MSTDNQQPESENQTGAEEETRAAASTPGEGESAGEDGPGGGAEQGALPDWAVRQMETLQAGEQNEGVAADGEPAPTTAQDGELPDWAARKMEQFQASEDDGAADDAGQAAQSSLAEDCFDTGAVTLEPSVAAQARQSAPNLEMMLDLPLDATVELGRTELPLAQVLALKSGSVIQLDRLPGEPLDLLVNGQLVARGEIVVLNDTFAFRITDLVA